MNYKILFFHILIAAINIYFCAYAVNMASEINLKSLIRCFSYFTNIVHLLVCLYYVIIIL